LDIEDSDLRRVFRAVGKTDDGRVELKRLAKSIWSPELQVNSTGEVDGAEASPSEIDQLNQLISAKKASPHSAHNNNQQHSQQAGQDDSIGSAGVEADNLNRSMSFSEQALDPAAADGSEQQQVEAEASFDDDLQGLMQSVGLEQYTDALLAQGFEDVYTVSLASPMDLQSIGFRMGHALKLLQACERMLSHGAYGGVSSPGGGGGGDVVNAPPLGAASPAAVDQPVGELLHEEQSRAQEIEELRRTAGGTARAFARYTAAIDPTGATTGAMARAEAAFFQAPLSKEVSSSEPERTKAARAAAHYMARLLCQNFHSWRRVAARRTYVQGVLLQVRARRDFLLQGFFFFFFSFFVVFFFFYYSFWHGSFCSPCARLPLNLGWVGLGCAANGPELPRDTSPCLGAVGCVRSRSLNWRDFEGRHATN
jgi:hypothetical protein